MRKNRITSEEAGRTKEDGIASKAVSAFPRRQASLSFFARYLWGFFKQLISSGKRSAAHDNDFRLFSLGMGKLDIQGVRRCTGLFRVEREHT